VQKNKKISLIFFAYGFMGKYSLESFKKNKFFDIKGIIVPGENKFYKSNFNLNKISKKVEVLKSDNKIKIYNFIKRIKPNVVLISTFNKILDKKIIKLSKFINIHHGKLPKQKGRASVNWAILMGRNSIYITIHQVISKLDSGKIIQQKKIKIESKDNYQSVQLKIGNYLKNHISKIVFNYLQNKIKLKKNNQNNETWNSSRNPEDGMINFHEKTRYIHNLIRACSNKDFGAFCFLKEKKIIILESKINKRRVFEGIIPGRIIKIYKNGDVDCLCSDGILTIKKIYFKNKILKPSHIIKSTRDTLLND
tara:strand:- start:6218 stop:7141 length:924 start_codon:yes stop_codon:yes gene_type:complete